MAILTRKPESNIYTCVVENPLGLAKNALFRIDGALPAELAEFFAPETAPVDGRRIWPLDASAAVEHLRAEKRRAATPYQPPKQISKADVLKRFAWTADDFERAVTFNFPAPVSRRISMHGWNNVQTAYFKEDDISTWVALIRSLAASLGKW